MESYNDVPKNYKRGKTKYIIVTGSVMSGVGKGTFTSSLANLLMFYGLKVNMIKFDGYLNVDAGTLNPYRHGEVFVLEDGTETDLDLGTYERALHRNLTRDNYLTSGKIFKRIIEKERKGEYLGRDVQFIPHVTSEIKNFIRSLAVKESPDILIVEVGGSVGDLENSYFIEAMRELRYEEGKKNVMFVNVTYIINTGDEQKSKAAQLGISKLMSLGVLPDLVVCRSKEEVKQEIKEKISMVSNIPVKNVISFHNLSSIYYLPIYLKKNRVAESVFSCLDISGTINSSFYEMWMKFLSGIKNHEKEIEIAIPGKYTNIKDSYLSIIKAIEHCSAFLKTKINLRWIETTDIDSLEKAEKALNGVKGIIVPGGFGSRGTEGKILCIEYARKNNLPFLGLCYGMQLAVIEYARNVCNMKDANSTEINEKIEFPVIDILPEQKKINEKGGTMRLGLQETEVKRKTLAYDIYGKRKIKERFRHRYEVNPDYIEKLENSGIIFSGKSRKEKNIMQILELPREKHKFFFATQFHPELTSKPLIPSPVFVKFVSSCLS